MGNVVITRMSSGDALRAARDYYNVSSLHPTAELIAFEAFGGYQGLEAILTCAKEADIKGNGQEAQDTRMGLILIRQIFDKKNS